MEHLQEEARLRVTVRQLKEIQRQQSQKLDDIGQKLDDLVKCANRIAHAVACAESRQDAWTADYLDVDRHRAMAEEMTPRW